MVCVFCRSKNPPSPTCVRMVYRGIGFCRPREVCIWCPGPEKFVRNKFRQLRWPEGLSTWKCEPLEPGTGARTACEGLQSSKKTEKYETLESKNGARGRVDKISSKADFPPSGRLTKQASKFHQAVKFVNRAGLYPWMDGMRILQEQKSAKSYLCANGISRYRIL
jgi:hypothetical protein